MYHINRWRQPNWISRGQVHSNGRFNNVKNPHQQCYFNPGAKFLVIDINNFYLNTPLGRFNYMVINLALLPQETIDKYDLSELEQDGKVYIEIQKGMYGLPQAVILTNELLQRNIAKDGYHP
jgi:hypothetical protein